jgi:hypothetical protein
MPSLVKGDPAPKRVPVDQGEEGRRRRGAGPVDGKRRAAGPRGLRRTSAPGRSTSAAQNWRHLESASSTKPRHARTLPMPARRSAATRRHGGIPPKG